MNSDILDKLENLKRMNRNRFDYVLARSRCSSIADALKEIGLTTGWYYKFSEDERQGLEKLAEELHYEQSIQAHLILVSAASEAAQVKVKGMQNPKNPRIQQEAATEILDRVIGKPLQRNEISGKDGGPMKIIVTLKEDE